MKFEAYSISKEIKTNLAEQGFRRPTDIQYKAIPPILKGEDVLAIAQTGTGKTAAVRAERAGTNKVPGNGANPRTCRTNCRRF